MAEYRLGLRAKARLKQLVKSGKITLERGLGREHYGRELARLRIDGRDVGDILMAEGLAKPFNLRPPKPVWC
jgi:endonuclease YncB( thermonuclease family)